MMVVSIRDCQIPKFCANAATRTCSVSMKIESIHESTVLLVQVRVCRFEFHRTESSKPLDVKISPMRENNQIKYQNARKASAKRTTIFARAVESELEVRCCIFDIVSSRLNSIDSVINREFIYIQLYIERLVCPL